MNNYPSEILKILKLSCEEKKYSLEEILKVIGEYPIQLKKNKERNKLIIKSLEIKGMKKMQKMQNEEIDAIFTFFSGVNVICSNNNNLQGKTSLLKIIKFMLTGNEEALDKFLINNIKKFKITLQINEEHYIFEYNEKQFIIYKDNISFYSCEKKDAQKYLSKFFEEKFNYYPLKYVSSLPNSYDFDERSFTWSSYFSTLYLDSKEYNTLFTKNVIGGLKNKIIGILFNLEHNQFLNKIDTKQKMIGRELERIKFLEEKTKLIYENEEDLQNELNELEIEFENISLKINNEFNYEKEEIINLKKSHTEKLELYEEIQLKLFELKKEKILKTRKLNHKEEEIALAKFIPINLSCPNCFKEIEDSKKKEAIKNGKCYICGEEHEYSVHLDIKDYTKKLKEELENIELREKNLKAEEKNIKNILKSLEKEYNNLKEDKISRENIIEALIEEKNNLYLKIRELKAKINFLKEKHQYKDSNILKIENDLLKKIVSKIKGYIYDSSISKMNAFIDEFTSEAVRIGIKNLEKIELNDSYEPSFTINGQNLKFEKISSGEQLRVKIAFYLTWLKIALKENGYNHPAFLMIDSPGKEETNPRDLEELSNIFKSLDNEQEEFQIIITSAKNLLHATSEKKLKIYKEYLF